MLYTQQLTIPDSGVIRIGTIGGSPDIVEPNGNRSQIGYQVKPRIGIVRWDSVSGKDPRLLDIVATIEGYAGRLIGGCSSPGQVYVEFPCSIKLTGTPGTPVIVEAWAIDSAWTRGARRSYYGAGVYNVPQWASSFDLSDGATATFRDNASNIVGVVAGPVTSFSTPDKTETVNLVGATATLVLRQEG